MTQNPFDEVFQNFGQYDDTPEDIKHIIQELKNISDSCKKGIEMINNMQKK